MAYDGLVAITGGLARDRFRDEDEVEPMQVETFTASNMQDAMMEVKRVLGSDAVILSTRMVKQRHGWLRRRREVVEVMAGRGVNIARPRAEKPVLKSVPNGARDEYRANSKVAQPAQQKADGTGKALMQQPGVQTAMIGSLAGEIGELKQVVTKLVTEVRTRTSPQVPEELAASYQQLIEAEVSDELATDIMRQIQQASRPENLANPSWVREKIVEHLEKLIPLSGPIERKKKTGPHVVALIGPTGVGKTTTVAKLAANLMLREHKSVGLITLDTYRIAAIDQLRKYAELIGVHLSVVSTPDEIAAAVQSYSDCDYVLIDTAGRSPNDTLKLNELGQFLEQAKPDEVHLVLSTTCGAKSAELALSKFKGVRVDKVIFTKLDETAQVGVVLQIVRKLNVGLSYVTTGQDVPDDIEVGDTRRLARLIVGQR